MWAAITLGLAGSLHCAGMCSPLAMAVTATKPFVWNKVVYNTGRVLTYGLLGLIAAAFGSLFSLTAYQSVISFSIGVLFLLMGVGAITGLRIPYLSVLISKLTFTLKRMFGFWLQKKQAGAIFVMGMLNGLLPCGLTYMALTNCFILPTAVDGFVFMVWFGFGTWPVMIGLSWLVSLGFTRLTQHYHRFAMVAIAAVGIWLMVRVFTPHSNVHDLVQDKPLSGEVICP